MPVNLTVVGHDFDFVSLTWIPPAIPYGIIEMYRISYQGFKQEISEVRIL